MTMSMSTDHNLISHDTQIIELANDINNLINEVADKVKKGLVEIEEKVLLNFKDAFVQNKLEFDILKVQRSQDVITKEIMVMKADYEAKYCQSIEKARQTKATFDRLKHELKKSNEYQHQLKLEIKHLKKQCQIARRKGELFDKQISELQEKYKVKSRPMTEQPFNSGSFLPMMPQLTVTKNMWSQNHEKRVKNRIEYLREYINSIVLEKNGLEQVFDLEEIKLAKTDKSKVELLQAALMRPQLKQYLFKVLYEPIDESQQ